MRLLGGFLNNMQRQEKWVGSLRRMRCAVKTSSRFFNWKRQFLIARRWSLSNEQLQKTRLDVQPILTFTRCLKITEKVSFNIASEASYVYILSGQKIIKNAKNGQFWRVFENLKLAVKQCYQTCQIKIGQKCQNSNATF